MDRVGILTFHNNANKGAILQAYCLKEFVADRFDVQASVIPYRTASKERQRWARRYVTRRPWRIPWRFADHRRCESFVEAELEDDGDRLVTDDREAAVEWLNDRGYDVVITGSDEVWKLPGEREGWRARLFPQRPYPNVYFLGDDVDATTVAYAASANRVRLSELDAAERERLRADLASIDHVSVRDDHTERLLERLGVPDVHRAPDPTLLVDLPTKPVASILREGGVDPDGKVLGFHASDGSPFDELCEHFRDRGYQIVSTMGSRHADLRLRGRVDPLEYHSAYRHFDVVLTDSLHSTIFSVQHRTPFATVDTEDVYRHVQSKTHSLLADLGLEHRHVDATDGDASVVRDRFDEFVAPLDDDHLPERLARLREQGDSFLQTALAAPVPGSRTPGT